MQVDSSQSIRVFTDVDLTDKQSLADITMSASWLSLNAPSASIRELEDTVDLVLGISCPDPSQPDDWMCDYYFAHHEKRLIFWLDPYSAGPILFNVEGAHGECHLKDTLEAQYWCAFVAKTQTTFALDDLKEMLDLANRIPEKQQKQLDEYHVFLLARLMKTSMRLKFENSRCQPGAQTSGNQSIYVDGHKEDGMYLFFRLCNLVLWNKLIASLSSEWVQSAAFSAVMLVVDISFMAVPMTGLSEHCMKAAFLAISVSTICAVGSVIISVLFLIQNQGCTELSDDKTATFMNEMTQTPSGIAVLAVMYGSSYGLLIWGLISFGVALSFLIFPSISSVSRLAFILVWTVVAASIVPSLVPHRPLHTGAGGCAAGLKWSIWPKPAWMGKRSDRNVTT
ncbi:hypothetical protein HYDPIDRAFT_29821 [Hydnomerulius pinastri MD-312]|uniref:Uncharacterized protein n=1 Tax=Hydnomerulius pinastri MD-312 TaxID=994086 RepID=A0A0C9VXX6_9AGAM|nr:hypothetical protein HYDPIDRAFT_29821 [Hydnomerulius pinastri MD-312]